MDSVRSPQPQAAHKYSLYPAFKVPSCCGESEGATLRQTASESHLDAQSQMAKHRGRTKKGRIAAALSEAFKKSSQSGEQAVFADQTAGSLSEAQKVSSGADSRLQKSLSELTPLSVASRPTPPSTASALTTTTATTAITEAKRSAPRAYRKRLIQSVVSSQSLMAKKQASEEKSTDDPTAGAADGCDDAGGQPQSPTDAQQIKGEQQGQLSGTEQLRETLHSPCTTKRKKKGKARWVYIYCGGHLTVLLLLCLASFGHSSGSKVNCRFFVFLFFCRFYFI